MEIKYLGFFIFLYWWFKFYQATKNHNNTEQIKYGIWWLSMLIVLLR